MRGHFSETIRELMAADGAGRDAAVQVLTDCGLLRLIVSFEDGLPLVVGEFWMREGGRRSPDGRYPIKARGVLPQLAVMAGDLDMLDKLKRLAKIPEHGKRVELQFHEVVRCAVVCGRLEVLQWLEANFIRGDYAFEWDLLDVAVAFCEDTRVLQWLDNNVPHMRSSVNAWAMEKAVSAGRIDTVRWLHEHYYQGFTSSTMDTAAAAGHLEIVQFLHENRREGCSIEAMNLAAKGGHLEVVRFLHEHRREGCTRDAMADAAVAGHHTTVKFLGTIRTEGVYVGTLNDVTARGDVEMIRLLCMHTKAGCLMDARRCAAAKGHSLAVKVLDKFISPRVKKCTASLHSSAGPRRCQSMVQT